MSSQKIKVMDTDKRNYDTELNNIPIENIERYLRRRKLENINKNEI